MEICSYYCAANTVCCCNNPVYYSFDGIRMNPDLSVIQFSMILRPVHIVLFFSAIMMLSSCLSSQNDEMEYEEEYGHGKPTGVDKQLGRWFEARAYPDPYYLNSKFAAAWQQAQAMRTPVDYLTRGGAANRTNFGAWVSLNGPDVGRILSIAIHPTVTSTLFIGSASGGIWKSTNSGSSWLFVPTNLPVLGVPAITFHPSNGNILLAGTGEVYRVDTSNIGYNVWKARGTYGTGIIRSTDGGITWTSVLNKNTAELFGVQMIKYDPSDPSIVYACTTHGLFKSTDGGATWGSTPVLNKIYVSDVVINSGNNQQIMAAVGNLVNADKGIYRTTDGGANWTKISSAAIPTSFSGYSRFAYLSGNTVYISMGRNDAGEDELFRSANFGSTWTAQNNSHHCEYQFWFANAAAIIPSRPDSLFIAGVNFYRHRVSTETTTAIGTSMHSDFHDIKFDPSNSNIAYIACDGGVYRTANALAASPTFTEINTGLVVSQFYASFGVSETVADRYVGGLQDNGVWSYTGSGWVKEFGGDGGPSAVDPVNANNVFASNDARSVSKSTGGVTGSYGNVLNSWAFAGDDRTGFMSPLAISKTNPSTIYVASDNLHKSTDGGASWTNNNPVIASNTNYIEAQYKTAVALAVSPANANKIYVSLSNFSQRTDNGLNVTGQPSVRKSINGGTSFTAINGSGNDTLPHRFVLDFAISPTNDDSVFVVLGGFRKPATDETHVYVTGNGGLTWRKVTGTLPDAPVNAIVFDPTNSNILYVGTDLGVYVSANRGTTWHDFNTGMATTDPVQVFDLQISADNKLVAATHGRGAWRTDLFDVQLLPVSLISFTGNHDKGYNKLQWTTENENSLRQYELERSINGSSYERIATVPSRNQPGRYTYDYNDAANSRMEANYYYRLKTVDMDGSFTYSSVVFIRIVNKEQFTVLMNPVSDRIAVQLSLDDDQPVTLNLFDMQGKLVRKQQYAGVAGVNQFTISNTQSLSKGIYVIEAVINRQRFREKLLKN